MTALLKIGTRGSPLALAQAREVAERLSAAHRDLAAPGAVETVVIRTTGDAVQHRPLAEIGGKGLFTKEIDDALLSGAVDIAVHSMKDVPTWLPDGVDIPCLLPREDPRDALFADGCARLDDLPQGAVVGTAALRRQAQVLARRPDLKVVPIRGNVQTRLRKLAEGQVDATMLAVAGLRRLGMTDRITAMLPTEEMLPAVAQGAIGVACRSGDATARGRLEALHCAETGTCVAAERALLTELDGSCRTPIAALARLGDDGRLSFDALIARPDGTEVLREHRAGASQDAEDLGRDAALALKSRAGPGFLEQ